MFFSKIPDFLLPLFTKTAYPWEIIPLIKEYISEVIESELCGFRRLSKDVLIADDVEISPTALIEGRAIIASGAAIRHGAYLRGDVIISDGCVVGNSTEIKNSILLPEAKSPHFNYVGDSILGAGAHLGAGAICSNLKSDKSSVVIHYEGGIQTHLKKLGAIVGDGAEIGCGSVLNPGTVIGKRTTVYPLCALRGVYPEDVIVKSKNTSVKKNNAKI